MWTMERASNYAMEVAPGVELIFYFHISDFRRSRHVVNIHLGRQL
jgi:hypothetical protein